MTRSPICLLPAVFVAASLVVSAPGQSTCTAANLQPRMLSHDVYFTLKDDSPAAKKKLVAGCGW